HYIYIAPLDKMKETYFKYSDEKIIEKIDHLADRLNTQIDQMDRLIRKQERIAGREMSEAELFKIENDTWEEYGDNLERFEKIIDLIDKDQKTRQELLKKFLEEEELHPKITLKELRNKSARRHGKT